VQRCPVRGLDSSSRILNTPQSVSPLDPWQKLSIELDRLRDNFGSVTFAMAATEFAEASQVVKIISGEIEPP
jgi:hypothetical protein